MANPQKEDGYVAIANDIVEALSKQTISPDEWKTMLVILRKTYGWNKKEDWISLSQFCESTGMRKPHVCRSLSKLLQRGIITRSGNGITRIGNEWGSTYGFEKDFEKWNPLPKQVTLPKQVMTVTQTGNENNAEFSECQDNLLKQEENSQKVKSLPKQGPTKDIINIKPSITKARSKRNTPMADEEFWQEVRKIYTWINIDQEIQKMKGYMISPKGKRRRWKMTQQRVIEWLNRIDKPIEYQSNTETDYPRYKPEKWMKETGLGDAIEKSFKIP